MEKELSKDFNACPNCGSIYRFFEELGDELKVRGIARTEWSFCMDVKQGVVVDQAKEPSIPIGSEVPTFGFKTDICFDCGTIYATNISRSNVKKSITPAMPNREQRRREMGRN